MRNLRASIGPGGIEICMSNTELSPLFAASIGPGGIEIDVTIGAVRNCVMLQSDRVELKFGCGILLAAAIAGFNRTGWN